jgi:FkbM family methyltransferase
MLPQVNIIRAKNADFLCFWEQAGISGVLTAHGVWDEPTINLAKALIDQTPWAPVVLDVGANMGTFSIPIAKYVGKLSGVVHSFEPQRIVYYQLCGNVFLNRMDNIFAHNLALSDVSRDGDVRPLDYAKSWNIGAYSIGSENQDAQERIIATERISFLTLDEFEINSTITLIKIDVEGMELEVLRGG